MNADRDYLAAVGGWMFSIMLHGLGIGTAIVLAADFSVLPHEKSFKWEISLIAASLPDPISSDLPVLTPRAAASDLQPLTPDVSHSQTTPSETAFHKTIAMNSPVADAPADVPHRISHVHAAQALSARKDKASHEAPLQPDVMFREPSQPQQKSELSSPDLAAESPVTATIPGQIPPPDIDSVEHSLLASEPSVQEPLTVAHRPLPQYRDSIVSQTVQADHRWLAETLFKKVEQHKRYPHSARAHRWEGNVMLQAIVREDGQVGNITVVESSGHPMLDQEAIALLERISPITLKHPLGQPHIVVQLPIGYRLE